MAYSDEEIDITFRVHAVFNGSSLKPLLSPSEDENRTIEARLTHLHKLSSATRFGACPPCGRALKQKLRCQGRPEVGVLSLDQFDRVLSDTWVQAKVRFVFTSLVNQRCSFPNSIDDISVSTRQADRCFIVPLRSGVTDHRDSRGG